MARIYLLGRFEVEVDGKAIPRAAWSRRRPVELLTAVALAPGFTLHREEVLDRLWPDKDLEAGANNLYRTIHELRRAAGHAIVTAQRGSIQLCDGAWVDVAAFEKLVASGERDALAEAVAIYRGDLLPDDPYADALQARREGLRQRFVDAALRLSELDDDLDRRIEVLRRLVAIDPTLEPAHRGLIVALAKSGRTKDALEQFAICVQELRTRLDVAPSADTLALQRRVTQGELGPRPEPSPLAVGPTWEHVASRLLATDRAPPLCGRDDALRTISTFAAQPRGLLLVVGEAGLGKTRLAVECARRCGERGDTLLVGLGYEFRGVAPYTPFVDAWSDHLRCVGRPASDNPFVAFEAVGTSAQEDRLRLFQAIERALVELARDGSVCLVVEDVHDADESSLYLLYHLARASRHLPIKLVATARVEEIRVGNPLHTVLGGLGRERLASRLDLEPLDLSATRALVRSIRGDDIDDASVLAIHRLCGGNPFFTDEVARAPSIDDAPGDLLGSIHARVTRLGPDAERLLCAAAVAGQRFEFEVVRRALGAEPQVALDALDAGLAARVVEEHEDHYRFRHALTRRALIDSLSHARRVFLHRALADALEGAARHDAERLAYHHQVAGQLDRALPYVLEAAVRARARLGFGEAVAFSEQALELMDALGLEPDERRFHVRSSMGSMRLALGDLKGAVADLDAAVALRSGTWSPSPAQRAQSLRLAALGLIQSGDLDAAEHRLDTALAALDDARDSPELGNVYYLLAQLRWHQGEYARAHEFAERSLAEAEARGDAQGIARAYEMLALAYHSLGDWKRGTDCERKRFDLARGPLDVASAFDVHLCLWEYHLYGDAGYGGIRDTVAQTLAQAERMGAPRALALCHCFSGALDFQTARWETAERSLRDAVRVYREVGSASGESLALQRLGTLVTARGDVEAGRECVDQGIAVAERAAMRSHCLTRLFAALMRNRLAAGDRIGVQESLAEGSAAALRHGSCVTCSALLYPEVVRAALAVGEIADAEWHAAELERTAANFESPAWVAMAAHARGRVLLARGDFAAAADRLDHAARAFTEIEHAYDAARCRALGARCLRTVDPERAETLALAARTAFTALGAPGIED